MPGLVLRQSVFLFQYHDAPRWYLLCEAIGGCQAQNSAANNADVCLLHKLSL